MEDGAVQPETGGDVLVFMEQTDGVLEGVSVEVLGKAREIADTLHVKLVAILFGDAASGIAEETARRGADVVLFAESPLLKDYTTEAYLKVLVPLVNERTPTIILMGGTHNGTSLAASLAVRLGAGLMAHVVNLEVDKQTGTLFGSVPGFGGSIVAVCKCKRRPQMATVRPGIFKPLPPRESGAGRVESVPVSISADDLKCRVLQRSTIKAEDISRAEKIVVAGLGTKGDLSLPQKLAQTLGASFGVSRPLADKGMAPRDRVVGSTGYSLNAELAILAGVSGAAHFASGIRDAKTVVAINSDSNAQIFKHADYCVAGDLFEILPELISALEASKGEGP